MAESPQGVYLPRRLVANDIYGFEHILFRACILALIAGESAWLHQRVLLHAVWQLLLVSPVVWSIESEIRVFIRIFTDVVFGTLLFLCYFPITKSTTATTAITTTTDSDTAACNFSLTLCNSILHTKCMSTTTAAAATTASTTTTTTTAAAHRFSSSSSSSSSSSAALQPGVGFGILCKLIPLFSIYSQLLPILHLQHFHIFEDSIDPSILGSSYWSFPKWFPVG